MLHSFFPETYTTRAFCKDTEPRVLEQTRHTERCESGQTAPDCHTTAPGVKQMCSLAAKLPRKQRVHGFQGGVESCCSPPPPPAPLHRPPTVPTPPHCAPADSLPHHFHTGVSWLVISSLECEISDSDAPHFYPLPLWLMGKLEWRTLLVQRALNRQQRTHMLRRPSHAPSNIVDMHTPSKLQYPCTDTCPRTDVHKGTNTRTYTVAHGQRKLEVSRIHGLISTHAR